LQDDIALNNYLIGRLRLMFNNSATQLKALQTVISIFSLSENPVIRDFLNLYKESEAKLTVPPPSISSDKEEIIKQKIKGNMTSYTNQYNLSKAMLLPESFPKYPTMSDYEAFTEKIKNGSYRGYVFDVSKSFEATMPDKSKKKFEEFHPGEYDCGFKLLGTTRKKLVEELLKLSKNEGARNELA